MLFWGYASGGDAVAFMEKYHLTKIAKRFKVMSLSILGGILGMMPFWRPEFRSVVSRPRCSDVAVGDACRHACPDRSLAEKRVPG